VGYCSLRGLRNVNLVAFGSGLLNPTEGGG
jgi:hypothetical protein